MSNKTLSHFDQTGNAHMVDVAEKAITHRKAIACGQIVMQQATLDVLTKGQAKKGDVLGIARIAAIMGAKKTSDIIPLCHPLPLTHIAVDFEYTENGVQCTATVETDGKTGVEMEALTAVNIALLTIYDMLKAIDRGMLIKQIHLLEKSGGKSGLWQAPKEDLKP